ncbi:MAG: hypothetical protein HWE27_08385 [Gammaproteobacteria bacterium]|nr:hypothetical protein [Gammaproteobacteria bacterium]
MIANYLSQVIHYLTEEQKQEVSDELESIINDKLEDLEQQQSKPADEQQVSDILISLGHPIKIASAYRNDQYLISPEFFPIYRQALIYALGLTAIVVALLALPSILSSGHIIRSSIQLVFSVIDAALVSFAAVTVAFYLQQKLNLSSEFWYKFDPKSLNNLNPKLKISRLETGFEFITIVLFLAWWNDLLQWSNEINFAGKTLIINLSDAWQAITIPVNIVLTASIIVTVWQFILGRWQKFTLILDSILNVLSVILVVLIMRFDHWVVFNEAIMQHPKFDKVLTAINLSFSISLVILAMVFLALTIGNILKLRKI